VSDDQSGAPPVEVRLDNGIMWITLSRAGSANALNADMRRGLWEAFHEFNSSDDALVAVLTGAGEKAFCAGGDLKEMAEENLRIPPPDFMPHLNRNIDVTKPVIAAVNGVALGGGFLLSQMSDLCVAAEHATFGITEARWGRGSPWANPLAWLIPPRVALQMMMTAEPISAQRAYEVGLVNSVVPMADLLLEAEALARKIAGSAPLTVRAAKQMVYHTASAVFAETFDDAEELFRPVYESQDAQEGPRAFREKRHARWSGR
jgi:enoyl-CoA hydratase/carnithine racemase